MFISFVCLFVKCFGSPHSGESEVIYLHVLPQSTTKGGCQCISLNRKVPSWVPKAAANLRELARQKVREKVPEIVRENPRETLFL